MSWLVRHKNVKVLVGSKDEWAIDGHGANWTKEQAKYHVFLCEFEAHKIPYEIVEEKTDAVEPKKT